MTNETEKPEASTELGDRVDSVVIHHGSLYGYSCGCNCGVLIKENVMKKLAKLQKEHLDKVKRLLIDEYEKENVFSSMWTLHYPNDVQTAVRFIDTNDDTVARISAATRHDQPIHEPLVFIAGSMEEAENMADAHSRTTKG